MSDYSCLRDDAWGSSLENPGSFYDFGRVILLKSLNDVACDVLKMYEAEIRSVATHLSEQKKRIRKHSERGRRGAACAKPPT